MSSIALNSINAYWNYKIAEETLEINRASEKRIQDWTTEAEGIFIKKMPIILKKQKKNTSLKFRQQKPIWRISI